jgi:hypothetical protein
MDNFKQIRMSFFALLAGQIFYFLVSFFLVMTNSVVVDKDYDSLIGFMVPIIVVILVVGSKLLYSRLVNRKIKESSLDEKIFSYRTSNIIKFALLEAANLLSVTLYLITGDFLYVGMFIIVTALYLMNIPDKEKFIVEYELNREDINKLK